MQSRSLKAVLLLVGLVLVCSPVSAETVKGDWEADIIIVGQPNAMEGNPNDATPDLIIDPAAGTVELHGGSLVTSGVKAIKSFDFQSASGVFAFPGYDSAWHKPNAIPGLFDFPGNLMNYNGAAFNASTASANRITGAYLEGVGFEPIYYTDPILFYNMSLGPFSPAPSINQVFADGTDLNALFDDLTMSGFYEDIGVGPENFDPEAGRMPPDVVQFFAWGIREGVLTDPSDNDNPGLLMTASDADGDPISWRFESDKQMKGHPEIITENAEGTVARFHWDPQGQYGWNPNTFAEPYEISVYIDDGKKGEVLAGSFVIQIVPEPSTLLMLLSTALLGMMLWIKGRK